MSIYDSIDVGTSKKRAKGDYVAIPEGNHGDGNAPALKVVQQFNPKTDTTGTDLHGYLVAFDNKDKDGTAFLTIKTRPEWLAPEAVALAFGADTATKMLTAGTITGETLAETQKYFIEAAENRAIKNNTPDDQLEKATQDNYDNTMIQIRINVGQIFRLQDWAGTQRSTDFDPAKLVGTRFSASVEPGFKAGSSEVKTVFSKKKVTVVTAVPVETVTAVPF